MLEEQIRMLFEKVVKDKRIRGCDYPIHKSKFGIMDETGNTRWFREDYILLN